MRPVSGLGSRRSCDEWERFFELVCAGSSLSTAAAEIGVARQSAWERWRISAPMELKLLRGHHGGLGQSPLDDESVEKTRVRRSLTSEDRAVIAAGLRKRWTYAEIGEAIGRSASVICREVARNKGPDGSYHGALAHAAARERRRRPKEFRLVAEPGLCRRIETWMDEGWSPKLIAQVLKEESPHMIMGRVSHETIYQALYVQTRGSLRKDLYRQLSTTRPRRQPRVGAKCSSSPYKEAFKISQRPPEVADRAVPGHWEGDLVLGTGNTSAVGTLVE